MKTLAIGILLIAAVVFGGLYLRQTRKAAQAATNAEGLQQKVSELQSGIEEQEKQTTQLRDQLDETRADVAVKTRETAQVRETLQANLASQTQRATAKASAQTNSKPSNPLSEMFKNPQMKEMIKSQQKTALSTMIDKNYGKFFSDLGTTPEQSAALRDMILNKQLTAAEMGMSMFSDDPDPTKRAELAQQIKTSSEAVDAQIKEFLGDDNFVQFQAYEKTMAERMVVSGFKDQLVGGTMALTGDQELQLIQAMTQERQGFKFTTDFSDKSKFEGDFASMFTEDKMNSYFQEQGRLNQQYLSRARSLLSPDQVAAFEKYLEGQQAMQKAGMQMAVKLFAPAKTSD